MKDCIKKSEHRNNRKLPMIREKKTLFISSRDYTEFFKNNLIKVKAFRQTLRLNDLLHELDKGHGNTLITQDLSRQFISSLPSYLISCLAELLKK